MDKITFEEFRNYNRWFSDTQEEISREIGHFPYKTSISELKENEFGTTCGRSGNKAFENVSVEGDVVAILDTDENDVSAGLFWVDLENEDEALKFRDEILEWGGSARYSGEYNDGFVFEVE